MLQWKLHLFLGTRFLQRGMCEHRHRRSQLRQLRPSLPFGASLLEQRVRLHQRNPVRNQLRESSDGRGPLRGVRPCLQQRAGVQQRIMRLHERQLLRDDLRQHPNGSRELRNVRACVLQRHDLLEQHLWVSEPADALQQQLRQSADE